MYELGFALPFIVIIGGIIWFIKEAIWHNDFYNEVDKQAKENENTIKEYMDNLNKK